jgi:hypothetical protein
MLSFRDAGEVASAWLLGCFKIRRDQICLLRVQMLIGAWCQNWTVKSGLNGHGGRST